jgi:iron complex transport system ATP-binding protein
MTRAARLQALGVSLGYGGVPVVREVSLALGEGQVTSIVGPNGSGKSTVLRALARLRRPESGRVLLDGEDIARLGARQLASRLSILPQAPVAPASLSVRELVEQGRYASTGMVRPMGPADRAAIAAAMELTDTTQFADRDVDSLSGGERQRAWIALALAQDAPMLLLDEPTTYLDVGHQFEILELVRWLADTRSLTIGVVLQDLNHAGRYSDRVIVMQRGQVVADGRPADVLTGALVADVFRVHATIEADLDTGRAGCTPTGPVDGRHEPG